ncbi:MAG: TIGR02147 family protein [Bdellovibrionota bacterium]
MSSLSIFDYQHYQAYLSALFSQPNSRGRRSELAAFLRCQSSFVSQVFTKRAHFSLEHSVRISDFLKHSPEERRYFMLLVQKDKAGSKELEVFYQEQVDEARAARQIVRDRIQVKAELETEDQMTYYSTWWYAAIHVLVAMPGTQTPQQIAEHLKLPMDLIKKALRFLTDRGLIAEKAGRYSIGKARIHLGQGSPLLPRHHANWRMRAIQEVDMALKGSLHYSGVIGVSRSDAERIKSRLLDILQETESVIQKSKEEKAYVMLIDFFDL